MSLNLVQYLILLLTERVDMPDVNDAFEPETFILVSSTKNLYSLN
jgi:hypothetical protein